MARALLLLAGYGKQTTPIRVIPQISQNTLAEMVGTTRSRVNCFLNTFRTLGFIDYNGEFKINCSLLIGLLQGSGIRSQLSWWCARHHASFFPKPFRPETLARKVRERVDRDLG